MISAAEQFASFADELCCLPFGVQISNLRERVSSIVPEIGQCSIYNQRAGRPKRIVSMTIEQLISNKTIYPKLVIPRGNDNSTNHAFCVIDDLIFDSTQKVALKLRRDVIDWICGEQGAQDTPITVYEFKRSVSKGKKYPKTNMHINW